MCERSRRRPHGCPACPIRRRPDTPDDIRPERRAAHADALPVAAQVNVRPNAERIREEGTGGLREREAFGPRIDVVQFARPKETAETDAPTVGRPPSAAVADVRNFRKRVETRRTVCCELPEPTVVGDAECAFHMAALQTKGEAADKAADQGGEDDEGEGAKAPWMFHGFSCVIVVLEGMGSGRGNRAMRASSAKTRIESARPNLDPGTSCQTERGCSTTAWRRTRGGGAPQSAHGEEEDAQQPNGRHDGEPDERQGGEDECDVLQLAFHGRVVYAVHLFGRLPEH